MFMRRCMLVAGLTAGALVGWYASASWVCFGDLRGVWPSLRGQSLLITNTLAHPVDDEWWQVDFELRNLSLSPVQIDGLTSDGNLSVASRLPIALQPWSSRRIACAVRLTDPKTAIYVQVLADQIPSGPSRRQPSDQPARDSRQRSTRRLSETVRISPPSR